MPAPLVPARLAFAADGTPFSEAYGDVYHSAEGGPAQARHVFLRGNGLPGRWRGRRAFTILETGFGFGLNFLATWQAWREDAARCERLHFVSIEKHPFTSFDLDFLLKKFPEFQSEAEQLLASWPMLVPGAQRLEFDRGKVVLTLFFSDIKVIRDLGLAADAFYLDGFSPAKNPDMWAAPLLKHLGRLAAPGASVATWSVAASVRTGLEAAGFAVEKRTGFASKKEMLAARLVRKAKERFHFENKKALVIGAGVAGAAVCERLCARGWEVTLIERHATPAAEASGNPAGIFHPVVSPDDSLFARLTRAAFLYALSHWPKLKGLRWERCGVQQLARDEKERRSQQRALQALAYPAGYAQFRESEGGLWFPEAGWISPPSLVNALLSACGRNLDSRFGQEVVSIEKPGENWIAKDIKGKAIGSAPVVVLANSADALRLAPQKAVRLRRVRGQLTMIPSIPGLKNVVVRGGFALPGIDGVSVVGASYDIDDDEPAPRADSHAGNLERLEGILPGAARGLDPANLQGRVAFRAVARDRLPLVGPIAVERDASLEPRGAGLFGAFAYGSRGLLWAGLGGELLASMVDGEPLPVEKKMAAALDPGRFALRAARRATTARA